MKNTTRLGSFSFLVLTITILSVSNLSWALQDAESTLPFDDQCLGRPALERNVASCPLYSELKGSPESLSGTCCVIKPLSFSELIAANTQSLDPGLKTHLEQLVNEVKIRNFSNTSDLKIKAPPTSISVIGYNLHQNREYLQVKSLFNSCDEFVARFSKDSKSINQKDSDYYKEACRISNADIWLVSELDEGVNRSDYRNSVTDIALSAHLNYAVAREFLEIQPKVISDEQKDISSGKTIEGKVYNFTENGVISRYPIIIARQVKLELCHDWYADELGGGGIFQPQELRHGTRNAVIARVQFPEPVGVVVAVAAHLESKTQPDCRRRQLAQILNELKDEKVPVVLAGDMNTINDGPGFYDELQASGFDVSGNDGASTFKAGIFSMRLDQIATRGSQKLQCFMPNNGKTLGSFKGGAVAVSDHAPIAIDIPTDCAPSIRSPSFMTFLNQFPTR
jgi:endonuclease/exonuclease/phosphatase family metal-dependent hydrolase